MSKRRKPGDIVRRRPGSGFCAAAEPSLVQIPEDEEWLPCSLGCGDKDCREWPNLLIVEEGPHKGGYFYHISECEMED